jgi:hypothetical protein
LLGHERLLLPPLLLGELALLLLERQLRLELGLLLGEELLLLPLFQHALLLLVLAVLPVELALPELGDFVGPLLRLGRDGDRRGRTLDFLFGTGRKGGCLLLLGQQVGRVLGQLGYGDEAGEVAEVGTLVVELDETVVLGVVSAPERLESLIIAGGYEERVGLRLV